jgi:PhoD-like phosphatase
LFIKITYDEGTILGEDQWRWLESVLIESTADFHVVVSSIQIFTSNPVVESWGHFPAEKKRLMDLMRKNDPSGLIFLSGDVHHGELSKVQVLRGKGESLWVEMTSSGLTHTCGDSLFNRLLCPTMLKTFSGHRLQGLDGPGPQEENKTEKENFFIGKNFGLITDASNSTMYSLNFTVIGIDSKKTELNYIVQSVRRNCEKTKTVESTDADIEQNTDSRKFSCYPDPITSVVMADFPLFIPDKVFRNMGEIFAAIILSILFLFSFFYINSYSKRKI